MTYTVKVVKVTPGQDFDIRGDVVEIIDYEYVRDDAGQPKLKLKMLVRLEG